LYEVKLAEEELARFKTTLIAKSVNGNSAIIDCNGFFVWKKNKYLETWRTCFEELLNADPAYVTKVTTRKDTNITEQMRKVYICTCMLDIETTFAKMRNNNARI
jgi:hypothetical protein